MIVADGKPLRTFPGIAQFVCRNSGQKTAAHFSWNCFYRRAENTLNMPSRAISAWLEKAAASTCS
ncbi:MAG: hypothetical protein E5X74_13830 [Mesorhizobium sp.]|nr:MAG: hypothetical protein E5X74_13830 [Mesorhizobium sp.]